MTLLLCTVVTFALCANPGVSAALAFGDLTVPIVWTQLEIPSCMGLGATATPADAQLETNVSIEGGTEVAGAYAGRVALRLSGAKIEMTLFTWPKISQAEQSQMRAVYQATLWHEIGHLLTARTSLAAEIGRPENAIAAGTRADFLARAQTRTDAVLARFNADQTDYDRLSDHGLRQSAAPPPLTGANTVVRCG